MRPGASVALVTLMALTACLTACGPDNDLSGSVEELFPIDVSRVEVLQNEEAFQVSYYRNDGADVDLVVRVTVALSGVVLEPGARVELAGEYAPGHARTTVIHLPAGEPARVFPPVRQGDLHLRAGGAPGSEARGDFSMSFEDSGGFGGGRTLQGRFRSDVQDAGFGDL